MKINYSKLPGKHLPVLLTRCISTVSQASSDNADALYNLLKHFFPVMS